MLKCMAHSRDGRLSRRQFLHMASAGAASITCFAPSALSASDARAGDKLRIACVGVGGKGLSDVRECSREEVVALCDVDESLAMNARREVPRARFYADWREMFDKENKNIDAVVVSTPDHSHAVVASAAMRLGKHVYCQKPLVQTVYEARYLRQLAKESAVVTQMGNQGSSEEGLRRAVEVIQDGVIGAVRQVHAWTNRPIWPQGLVRPAGGDAVPPNLKWNLWLGPASPRPYKKQLYHPFNWRGWFEFGTGAMGDMACHLLNMPFFAAKLGHPRLVELIDHSELNSDTYPKTTKLHFVFPSREGLPETELFWYDGNPNDKSITPLRPRPDLINDIMSEFSDPRSRTGDGCLLIGEKGKMFSPDLYGTRFFVKLKEEKEFKIGEEHEAVKALPFKLPRNRFAGNVDSKHHQEWVAGCKGGPQPFSNFESAAYLTEIILLGCLALRVGKSLEWDGPAMRASNAPEAARFIERRYTKGFGLA